MNDTGLYDTFAHASFTRSGGGWLWSIMTDADQFPLDIPSGPEDDIREASEKLKAAIAPFTEVVAGWNERSPDARKGLIDDLREKGRILSDALFGGRQREFADKLKSLDQPKLAQLTNGQIEQHLIEFCVLEDEEGEYFLGERCLCLYRLTTRDDGVLAKMFDPDGTRWAGGRNVGYTEDDRLDSSCAVHATPTGSATEEISVVRKLVGTDGALIVLDELSEPLSQPNIDTFHAWMLDRHNVKHFNCHLELTSRDFMQPRVRVRSGAFVGGSEMPRKDDYLRGSFLFLNSCSGIGWSSFRKTLPYYFDSKGAACVVFTTGPIDDAFATEFARIIYDQLDGEKASIHDAFRKARAILLKEGHPSALLYTYIGPDNFTLM